MKCRGSLRDTPVNRKIRVMHLNSYMGYDGPGRGIVGQVKYTDKASFENFVCEIKSTRHDDIISEIREADCHHITLNRNKFYDFSILWCLMSVLRKHKIEVLNTHNAVACWYGNPAAKLLGIPVVFTLRGFQSKNYKYLLKRSYLYNFAILLDRLTMMSADMIVAVSNELRKDYINNEHVPPNKIITILNAIDLEPFDRKQDLSRLRNKLGIGMNTCVIGTVGHIVNLKGHECLLDAARIVTEQHNDVVFLMIGDGRLKADLIDRTEKYGIARNFLWLGSVGDVVSMLSIMDIFVLPSLTEGLSRSLMESMAAGLPAVCSDISSNREVVEEGESGMFFPVNNSTILAMNLLFLIRNREIRAEMGKKALAKARANHDIRNLAHKYELLYTRIAKRHPLSGERAST